MQPAPTTNRIECLDALRGVAVLGIFIINIIGFSLGTVAFDNPVVVGGDGVVNHGLWTFTSIFVEGTMRGLFSLMFGVSALLFMARAPYPDGEIRSADLYYRRTIWLIVFGLVHGWVLLAPGDILLIYGIAGLFLFPFRVLDARSLVIAAVVVLGLLVVLGLKSELEEARLANQAASISEAIRHGAEASEEELAIVAEWEASYAERWPSTEELARDIAARTGSPATVFSSNARAAAVDIGSLLFWVADALLLMLVGMALYKWDIVTGRKPLRFYVLLTVSCYGIGLAYRVWAVTVRWQNDFSPALWAPWVFDDIGRVAITLGHVGLFMIVWHYAAQSRFMHALAATGRMALTNYVGQTVIANLIFSGIGFGLYGSMDRVEVYLVMIVIWAVQILFSAWWLARYNFGPLEWAWRGLTYWQRPGMRKT